MRALLIALFSISILAPAATPHQTRNVILITADGLRWQDLFTGIDPALMNEKTAGMSKAAAQRDRLWRDTPEARRELLLPFFWKDLAPRGVVLGNVTKGSSVRVTNSFRVSYPGYSEILTGRAQDEQIHGNDPIRNPTPTILELVREKLGLPRTKVALIGTWDVFNAIGEHTPGSVVINAGVERLDLPDASPRTRMLSDTQSDVMTPWDGERHDYFTFELALEYIRSYKPRLLHIAFGETDDWAHSRRYDRVLDSIQYFDRSLRKLTALIESMPEYRGKTTLVITSDHGRGGTLADFSSHGPKVEGAEQIWLAIAGPDTPASGELANSTPVFQRDIAPTILQLFGIDPASYPDALGHPIDVALRR
jgi:hypothetical protein